MRWEDERYVRFYTRNTPEWRALSWAARGLFGLIMREVDRAGILTVGRLGLKGVAVAVEAPWIEIEAPLRELLADGMVAVSEDSTSVYLRNFIEAQEAPQSDASRKRASREKARSNVTNRDPKASQNVTESHVESHAVTSGHSVPSVPCLAVPLKETASPPAARVRKPKEPKVPDQLKIDTDTVCEFYRHRWVDQWKPDDRQLPIVPSADWMQLRSVVRSYGVLEAQRLAKLFVDDPDPWLVKQGHALRHLPGRVNGYRSTVKASGRTAAIPPRDAVEEDWTGNL